ncbi:Sel1 repeat-containing protein [Desulfotignum phosphitoxidans DSM 13687]|uniref:Sel1 repeat-containing protein n=2 Tax=Desulfotignum phosphitoxidans TaxID=190898 RepID=S0FYY3_9BACT|nr:Sel1 repeat-containing protein [Desulfotignum phosphitoxidans DSM 13687]
MKMIFIHMCLVLCVFAFSSGFADESVIHVQDINETEGLNSGHGNDQSKDYCEDAYNLRNWDLTISKCTTKAENGDLKAQLYLAIAHMHKGKNEEGIEWLNKSIKSGNTDAEFFLGSCYANGWAVEKDISKAIEIYTNLLRDGFGEALDRIAELAENHVEAQFAIAKLYEWGDGVEKNNLMSIFWYRKAAENGNEQAFDAIERMAEDDIPVAQYNLAEMYHKGLVVQRNLPKALKWSRKAVENGFEDSKKQYAELVMEDVMYAADVREVESLIKKIDQECTDIKCGYDLVWEYIDKSGDRKLSLAEIARFQRNMIKWAIVENQKEGVEAGEMAAVNLSAILILPITSSSIIHSFDYNDDGVLSKDEVMSDNDFGRLVGINAGQIQKGIDFKKIGENAKELLKILPLP